MRRKSKRIWFVALGVFVAVFLFSFLIQKYKNTKEAEAASLAKFDPGYIISDYQMGNYNSMNEADIQRFLTAKNPCSNTNYNYYKTLSANKNYKWHFKDGHFVCLSEERFGDGEVIGSGQSAAHIIYRAAQDYKINPQVIIVLLQKETSLITDPIPNNGDYRKAAGYGCPDTAACSSKYYGFKNQVRNAAKMFRTVLDGGWTNYPLGKNYVQYNPNKACGGSIVNIRSLATSALYRYTPYQPNAGALAAGYGTAACGAYGNRNFYLYFQDWFGGITSSMKTFRIPDGIYFIQTPDASMGIAVAGDVNKNGSNVQLSKANNSSSQRWRFIYNSKTDDYSIISGSGKALDVSGAGVGDGTNIQIWSGNNSCAQRWKIINLSDGNIKILSSCSSKVVDVSGGKAKEGANINLWTKNNNSTQKWRILPAEIVKDGLYYISSAINNNKVVDIAGGSHVAKNGTNVQLWSENYSGAQRWYIERQKDGHYIIINKQSNNVLDVSGAGTTNGTNVGVWSRNDSCAQKWKILKESGKYTFISACSNKVLDVNSALSKNGSNIQIYSANNTAAQKWGLNEAEIIKNGNYKIMSKVGDNKMIDIAGKSKKRNANVQISNLNASWSQKWKILYNKKSDYYNIENEGANKALDVEGAGRTNGTNVHTWSKNNTCAQKWTISKVGNKYIIYSACSGLALDVAGGINKNGANINLYELNWTDAQKWILENN